MRRGVTLAAKRGPGPCITVKRTEKIGEIAFFPGFSCKNSDNTRLFRSLTSAESLGNVLALGLRPRAKTVPRDSADVNDRKNVY